VGKRGGVRRKEGERKTKSGREAWNTRKGGCDCERGGGEGEELTIKGAGKEGGRVGGKGDEKGEGRNERGGGT